MGVHDRQRPRRQTDHERVADAIAVLECRQCGGLRLRRPTQVVEDVGVVRHADRPVARARRQQRERRGLLLGGERQPAALEAHEVGHAVERIGLPAPLAEDAHDAGRLGERRLGLREPVGRALHRVPHPDREQGARPRRGRPRRERGQRGHCLVERGAVGRAHPVAPLLGPQLVEHVGPGRCDTDAELDPPAAQLGVAPLGRARRVEQHARMRRHPLRAEGVDHRRQLARAELIEGRPVHVGQQRRCLVDAGRARAGT